MEKSPSSEANSHSASHEIPRLITEPKGSLPCSQEPQGPTKHCSPAGSFHNTGLKSFIL
jgi:hypothetical protein